MITQKYVEDILLKLGIPANLKGFKYITDAILLLDTEEWSNPKYTALYYSIGLMNHSTAARTERAIRHAFSVARSCKGDYDMVEHYIGFINCENSSSIANLYRNIKYELAGKEQRNVQEPVRWNHKPHGKDTKLTLSEAELKQLIHHEILKYLKGLTQMAG